MRVDGMDIYRVVNPIRTPYKTAFGTCLAFNSILIRLSSGNFYGWGESAPHGAPHFSPEFDRGAFLVCKDFLAPLILGTEIDSGASMQKVFNEVKGNYMAKAAFDLAWWNLHAKMQGVPLWKAIGGVKEEVSAGATVGVLNSIDALLKHIQGIVDAGYPRVKLKFCPGWEVEMVESVRNAFPKLAIHIDCNSAYTLADTDMFNKLDRFNLEMIEQPLMFDDLIDHAELQRKIGTPICLDESVVSPDKARKALQIKACRFINIKHGRVGGITNSIAIHDICADFGIPCWIGAMGESFLGVSFSISLATLPNVKYPSDLTSGKFYDRNLSCPAPEVPAAGRCKASNSPGSGAEPDLEFLEQVAQDKCFLKA